MEKEKYHCMCCGFETEIPFDVLKEITFGKFSMNHLPKVRCPYCSGYLIADDDKEI